MMDSDKPTHTYEPVAVGGKRAFNFGQVRLYGLPLSTTAIPVVDDVKAQIKNIAAEPNSMGVIQTDVGVLLLVAGLASQPAVTCGVIFGYAFEGHCYDLPKPKLMMIPVSPVTIPDDDCGYAGKPDYMVWVVDRLQKCVDLEITQGFIEEVVLESNMPGKRSPASYAGKIGTAHRSGRLE